MARSIRPIRNSWRYPLSPALEEMRQSVSEQVERLGVRLKSGCGDRAEINLAISKLRQAERRKIEQYRRAIDASIVAAKAEERQQKRRQKPRWQQKREAERLVRRVQLQMMPWTRAHAKYGKHRENQAAHLKHQLPKMQRQLPKCDRPRCGFPCGHPLRPKPCKAPVVAGRHPDTGAPILGQHCRNHGGFS
jgi:hypothetical protein